MSWDRCLFVHQICTFWYLVSKHFNSYSVIIHIWRHWRWKTVDICKIHRKLIIARRCNEMCVRVFSPRERVCVCKDLHKNFTSHELKVLNFMKIRAFVVEIFAKLYWLFKITILYIAYFHSFLVWKSTTPQGICIYALSHQKNSEYSDKNWVVAAHFPFWEDHTNPFILNNKLSWECHTRNPSWVGQLKMLCMFG